MMPANNAALPFIRTLLFRFLFIYFLLFIIVENNGTNPFMGMVNYHINPYWEQLASWTAVHVFHLQSAVTSVSNGSGDTLYHYLLLFIFLIISIAGAILWQIFDSKRTDYSHLQYWLTVFMRYYLGLMLINYGMVKLFDMQFGKPTMSRLSETYGASSPMGLAWTFLGFSHSYNVFMGIVEVCGILLLFRRTTTAGALIALMATLNVMMINYCYDVPVKIVSTALVIIALFILLQSAGPLLKFFFTAQAAALPIMPAPEINNQWLKRGKIALKAFILLFPLIGLLMIFENMGMAPWNGPMPKLGGLYEVDPSGINELPKRQHDSARRWKQLIISHIDPHTGICRSGVRYSNDSTFTFSLTIDTVQHTLAFTSIRDSNSASHFNYQLPDSNHLLLRGTIGQDSVAMLLRKQASGPEDFPLMKRGFHWVNERPYNM